MLAKIEPDGRPSEAVGRIPGFRKLASLESGPDGAVLVWSADPAFLAKVSSDLTLDSAEVPAHAWGGKWMGPAIPLSDSGYAIAPISNRQKWVPSPDPWIDAPFVLVLDAGGQVRGTAGLLLRKEGRYLAWLANRAVLGRRGDTIMALRLSSGIVTKYVRSGESSAFEKASEFDLIRYFEPTVPVEEIQSYPWIQDGGDEFIHVHVPQVETGAFGGERLYSIRNYAAEWVPVERRASFQTEGLWQVTFRGIEVYDLQGSRLASLALPAWGELWMRADMNGRLFLGYGDSVFIVRDPTMKDARCPPMPGRIDLPFTDVPP